MGLNWRALIIWTAWLTGVGTTSWAQSLTEPIQDLYLQKNATAATTAILAGWFGDASDLCGAFGPDGPDCVDDPADLFVAEYDLNGDATDELIVVYQDSGWCGTIGCPLFVVQDVDGRHEYPAGGMAQTWAYLEGRGSVYVVRLEDDPRSTWPALHMGELVDVPGVEHRNIMQGDGYQTANPFRGVYGRYAASLTTFRHMGLVDESLRWVGKFGVSTTLSFLDNPVAQERLMSDLLTQVEASLVANGAFDAVGQTVDGKRGAFEVTGSGIVAAGHRVGANRVAAYLLAVKENGWVSAPLQWGVLAQDFAQVELRLREFAGVSLRRDADGND